MRERLRQAIDGDSRDGLAEAIDSGAGVDELNECLQHAAWMGRGEIVRLLVLRGASTVTANESGLMPLHLAIENDQPVTVRELLLLGADPNAATSTGMTPLQLAVDVLTDGEEQRGVLQSREMIGLLLDAGADPDQQDHTGGSARSWAEAAGRPELLAVERPKRR